MRLDKKPTEIGRIAADLFLKRLSEQSLATSNRHIVDYLPTDITEALFDALIAASDRSVRVTLSDDAAVRHVEMRAIGSREVDVLPYLVTSAGSLRPATPNSGSEGYASSLRDHYAVDALRPRFLVVLTLNAIETQKSAQDAIADRALITLERLLHEVLDRRAVPTHSPLRKVVPAYRAHRGEEHAWSRLVEDFVQYADEVAGAAPEVQGAKLPMLGCFLPDPRPDFANGESVRILEDKDQRRRQRGEGRLFDNALLHTFLEEAFDDPVVDAEHVLKEVFGDLPEKASSIARGGKAGLDELPLETFAGIDQRRQKRQKNEFDRATLRVEGSSFFRSFGQGADTIVVVSAKGPFSIGFKLARPFNPRKEHAQVARWSESKNQLELRELPILEGAQEVLFPLESEARTGFAVWRLALTRGKRTLRGPIDAVLVVVYHSDRPEIVVEEGRLVSLDDQAWVAEGTRKFIRYTSEEATMVEVADEESLPAAAAEARPILRVLLDGSDLLPHVIDERPVEGGAVDDDGRYAYEVALELACSTVRRGHATTSAMRKHDHYLDAIAEIHEGQGRYRVDLDGGDSREIWAQLEGRDDPFRTDRAVGQLIVSPTTWRVEWHRGEQRWMRVEPPLSTPPSVKRFLDARTELLRALRDCAERLLPRFRRVPDDAAVPVTLLPMHQLRSNVESVLESWNAAVDDLIEVHTHFSTWHDVLLQVDTLRVYDPQGGLERVIVLPTHPLMLGALGAFQDLFARNVREADEQRRALPSWRFELNRTDVQQMLPRALLEDWYLWQPPARLLLADSHPFRLEFVPAGGQSHQDPLDYVSRVVANKVERYLRMHPHLRDERRTLRLGFVNPGTGRHLLDGLHVWLRGAMQEHAGRIRELPMEQVPNIQVFLFADSLEDGVGSEFERFFKEQVSAADEDVVRQALLARMQYRFCRGRGPESAKQAVHICFMHGLVRSEQQQGKTGFLGEWWDGGFGDGLLATYLRRTLSDGHGHPMQSRRGLWIDPAAGGRRGVLARIMAMQRGCRDSDLALEKAVYWETSLPDIRELASSYDHSDWVVHLDRELSLEIFRRGAKDECPTIIEYSDQEVPDSPGYDTITATRHATPYREQLGEILTLADLDVAGRGVEARRAANAILDDINALSGSWALDFLLGSIADHRTSMRLKGNVGAALAYRWLRRVELGSGRTPIVESNVGPVVPVFISLEDLLRATPAAGLSTKGGLVDRYTNELRDDQSEAARWCDDLLVLYLTRSEPGIASRMFGRVIEVKFGKTAGGAREKAVAQVQSTQQLLQERLSGDGAPLDATFRHKQLSLLIKAQLEQAVAMGVFTPEVYEFLGIPALSSNLATGRYTVDYTISQHGQHLRGDAFLLHTANDASQAQLEVVDGVRVVNIPRALVEWLAFELADSPTLIAAPASTLPHLGRYASTATQTGLTKHRDKSPAARPSPTQMTLLDIATGASAGAHALSVPEVAETRGVEGGGVRSSDPMADTANGVNAAHVDDLATDVAADDCDQVTLEDASVLPIKTAPYSDSGVVDAAQRLERALLGHKIRLASSPSPRETERGPRLIRVYVRLEAGESIGAVRRISEDIARVVGTSTSDIHITNVPERHAVGLDLPLPGLSYAVTFDELVAHPSFGAAQRALHLGFCAGIDVTGRPIWVDLVTMPHMLVAGTTGSGKTVFLRNLLLTLLLNGSPRELVIRLSSSKPMDFRVFTSVPHAEGREMARDPAEALQLAQELVEEMERRYSLLEEALCDNVVEYNQQPSTSPLPYVVAVFDEYAEMIASFGEKADRDGFEGAIGRLAQKARAAGIHLVICMQRPDANALKGAIKANILHRFALKLPQSHDSRIILDENGAETLLGQGDLLYKDANSKMFRLQVPFLENATLKSHLRRIVERGTVRGLDPEAKKTCPKCGREGTIAELFGTRKMKSVRNDGTEVIVERPQSYCRDCR